MSIQGSIVAEGSFTGTGNAVFLEIPSSFDNIFVWNNTNINAFPDANDLGVRYYFQNGMTSGRGVAEIRLGTGTDANSPMTIRQIVANNGFTLFNYSDEQAQAPVTIASSTNAMDPVFTASIAGLANGDIVRVFNVPGQTNLNGLDFSVENVTGGTFRMAAQLATAPGAPGTGGQYRIIRFDPQFYPPYRYIADITSSGTSSIITTTIPSGYQVGQEVRVLVPNDTVNVPVAGTRIYGMTQINNMVGTVTAVDNTLGTQTITVDIDSSAFSAFTFPTAAQWAMPRHRAVVVPAGTDISVPLAQNPPLSDLAGAYLNPGFRGVKLAPDGSDFGPAGASGNVIYWVATKAFSVNNN